MRKFLLLSAIFLSQLVTSQVQAFDVEARVAYFLPQDHRLRDLYGKNGFPEYELEFSMPLNMCCDCSCNWVSFFNLGYTTKKGHVRCHFEDSTPIVVGDQTFSLDDCFGDVCLRNKTKVEQWTLNLGAKYFFDNCGCFRPYLGFGLGAANVRFKDDSPFVRHNTDKWGFALLAKSGVEYDITCNIFTDLFLDYSYNYFCKEHSRGCNSTRSINTGGLKLGLGLGYRF